MHNFTKCKHIFVIFGTNHPDTSLYSNIKNIAQQCNIVTWRLEMTSYLTSSQTPFRDRRIFNKSFSKVTRVMGLSYSEDPVIVA